MRFAIATLLSLVCAVPVCAETVRSLDRIEPTLKTPEAKKFFSEQMHGNPAPDLLGAQLPTALTASAITNLLVPPGDKAKTNLIGAKAWPVKAQPNLHVAIVCTGGQEPYRPDEPRCARPFGEEKEPLLRVYLGAVVPKDGGAPQLVAASGPVACSMNWRNSGLTGQPMAAEDSKDGIVRPTTIESFDFAPYKITPNETAFGLRVSWMESYSGGGANFTGLCLFTMDGERLNQVLAVPMSAYSNTAGAWHKDGTRDHDIAESSNILMVSKQSTDGHFDLIVKARAGRAHRVFRWSKAEGAYRPMRK